MSQGASTQLQSGTVTSTTVARGQLFKVLNEGLQLNQYNLPDYIYRADLIPLNYSDYPPDQRMNFLDAASMEVTTFHGYPAIQENRPFWEQLPSESDDAYNAFIIYLEMPEAKGNDNPIRMLPMISQVTQIPLDELTAYAHMYYWHYRSRAYDLFIIACHRKQRELRMMTVEGQHFKMAEELLGKVHKIANKKLDNAINDVDGEMDDVKIKDLVDMTQKLVQVQRISVGLSANGTQQLEVGPRHAQSNDIMQHVARESSDNQQSTAMRSQEMDQLLSNPDDLAAIQDLMVRLSAPKSTAKH